MDEGTIPDGPGRRGIWTRLLHEFVETGAFERKVILDPPVDAGTVQKRLINSLAVSGLPVRVIRWEGEVYLRRTDGTE